MALARLPRPMHVATVAVSEEHEAVFADHLTRTLGIGGDTRELGKDRTPYARWDPSPGR